MPKTRSQLYIVHAEPVHKPVFNSLVSNPFDDDFSRPQWVKRNEEEKKKMKHVDEFNFAASKMQISASSRTSHANEPVNERFV